MSFPRYPRYKSSGVEWLGDVPEHWSVGQSRRLFALRNERALESDKQLTASQEHGVIYQDDFVRLEGRRVVQVITGADILKHVEPDDFVISMRSFQGGIERCEVRGCISSAYVMLVPCDRVYGPFFSYLLKSQSYIQALQTTSNLVRDGQALRYENFTKVDLPLVPMDEQVQVAAFLDRETAKIDKLVIEQQRLVELLKEKRKAVISHAVTYGIDPHIPLKPSGIDWLGDVPAEWVQTRIKYSLRGLIDTEHKTVPFFEDGRYLVVRTTNIKDGKLLLDGAKYTDLKGYQEWTKRGVPSPGDIMFTREAPAGEACLVPTDLDLCMGQRTVLMLIEHDALDSNFALWSLYGGLASEFISVLSQGSTVVHFNMSDIRNIPIMLPTLREQRTIANFLANETTKLDTLTAEVERAIDLLQERRSALISATVTGKIDVCHA